MIFWVEFARAPSVLSHFRAQRVSQLRFSFAILKRYLRDDLGGRFIRVLAVNLSWQSP